MRKEPRSKRSKRWNLSPERAAVLLTARHGHIAVRCRNACLSLRVHSRRGNLRRSHQRRRSHRRTIQSIEHTLRAFDKIAGDERQRIEQLEKTLSDYQVQANRPFEHDVRFKELLGRQAQLNARVSPRVPNR
jgi:hypothetical protein